MSFLDPDPAQTPTGLTDKRFPEQTPGSWIRIIPREGGRVLIPPHQSFQGISREQVRPGIPKTCLLSPDTSG